LNENTVSALGQAICDFNDQLITLSELPFPLKETSFGRCNLLKLLKLTFLSG
jgi:hypothetical protein